jgi:hypothetical protein
MPATGAVCAVRVMGAICMPVIPPVDAAVISTVSL